MGGPDVFPLASGDTSSNMFAHCIVFEQAQGSQSFLMPRRGRRLRAMHLCLSDSPRRQGFYASRIIKWVSPASSAWELREQMTKHASCAWVDSSPPSRICKPHTAFSCPTIHKKGNKIPYRCMVPTLWLVILGTIAGRLPSSRGFHASQLCKLCTIQRFPRISHSFSHPVFSMGKQKTTSTFLTRLLLWLSDLLHRLADALTPPPQLLMDKTMDFIDSAVIYECAKLGVTEAVGSGWIAIEDLARKLSRHWKDQSTCFPFNTCT